VLEGLLDQHLPSHIEQSLEIGSGEDVIGLTAKLRDRYGAKTHVVDFGDNQPQEGIIAHRCNIDHQPLPFGDATLDLVIFASIIEHLYNPHFVLSEIARVLKPGGHFLFEAPNAIALGRRLNTLRGHNPFVQFNAYNAGQDKTYMEYCAVFYTMAEAVELLRDCYTVRGQAWTMHSPKMNPFKALVRITAARIYPNLSDGFALIAKRKG
jgi:SAM-dependent methyltransferase